MSSWTVSLPLLSLTAAGAAAVAVAGVIAVGADRHRRRAEQQLTDLQQQLDADPESKRREIQRLEEELQTKRQQLSELDREHVGAQHSAARAERLRDEIQQLEQKRNSLGALQQQLEALRDQSQQLEAAARQSQRLQAEAEDRRRIAERASEAAAVHERQVSERLGEAQTECQRLRNEVAVQERELDSKLSDVRDLERQSRGYESIIERGEQARQRAAEIAEVQNKYEQVHGELVGAESALKEARRDLERLQDEVDNLIVRKNLLEARAHDGGASGENEVDQGAVNQRIADIWKPALRRFSGAVEETKEAERLEMVQKYLKEHSLERVMHSRQRGASA